MTINLNRLIGVSIVSLIAAIAIFAPFLAIHDPNASSIETLAMPSADFWMGTDVLGRDVFSRILHGARVSLTIGIGATLVGMAIGLPVGLFAGYSRGIVDQLIVQVIDLFISLPSIILALIFTAIVGASAFNLVFIIGFLLWPVVARLVRGQVISLRDLAFVEAARAVGCSTPRIIFRHILSNMAPVVVPQFTIMVSQSIFTAASLGFLGLGLPPPHADWGGMVQSGFDYIFLNPLLSLGPGLAVTITILGFYLIGRSYE